MLGAPFDAFCDESSIRLMKDYLVDDRAFAAKFDDTQKRAPVPVRRDGRMVDSAARHGRLSRAYRAVSFAAAGLARIPMPQGTSGCCTCACVGRERTSLRRQVSEPSARVRIPIDPDRMVGSLSGQARQSAGQAPPQ